MPNFSCYAVVISVGVAISLNYGELVTAQTPGASPVQPTPTAPQPPPASLNPDFNLTNPGDYAATSDLPGRAKQPRTSGGRTDAETEPISITAG